MSDRYDNLRVPVAENLRMKGTTPYYGANGIQDYVDGYTHDGEYILVAEDGANDLKNYPVNYVNGRIWVNNHAHVLQAKKGLADNRFLGYAVSIADIESVLVGGGRTKLNADELMNISFLLPNKDEQIKISSFMSSLDNLITLHKRKCEKLKKIKKAYLSELFPKNGEKFPKRRFAGFTDAWEQRKVSDLGEIFIGLVTTMTSHYTDKGSLLIRNSDIKDGYFKFGEEKIYLDEEFANQNSTRKHKIGDVITVHTGDIGTSAVISEKEADSIGFATIVTRPYKEKITSEYLCAFLNTEAHKNFAMNISTGDGRNNYNLKDYYKCIVPVPTIKEQIRISKFIETLNNLINLHQRKCEKLKKIKKAYLSEMFVSNDSSEGNV